MKQWSPFLSATSPRSRGLLDLLLRIASRELQIANSFAFRPFFLTMAPSSSSKQTITIDSIFQHFKNPAYLARFVNKDRPCWPFSHRTAPCLQIINSLHPPP